MTTIQPGEAVPWRPPRRRLRRAGLALLVLLVAAGAVGTGLAYADGRRWEKRADETADRLRLTRNELGAADAHIGQLRGELATAQGEARRLADERTEAQGQRDDARAAAELLADLATIASDVADDLEECVDLSSELTHVIANIEQYSYASALRFARDVGRVCGTAKGRNAELRALLSGD